MGICTLWMMTSRGVWSGVWGRHLGMSTNEISSIFRNFVWGKDFDEWYSSVVHIL